VIGLLLVQVVPALATTATAPAPVPSASSGSSSPTFSPDYLLLGQLKGTTVGQTDRPRSATITNNLQFAATYYGAEELQSAYGATSLFSRGDDGRGESIAIIDAYGDPTISQDLAAFDNEFGLPAVNLTVIPLGPYMPEQGIALGWDAETALDVEAAHTMAPYAHINLVVATNASNALFEAVKLVVTHRLGNVVSMSWGLGENSFGASGWSAAGFLNYPYVEYYFQLGAAEGISFFASTGDFGAFSGTTAVTAGYPADSPFVTGVGGTTLFLAPSGSAYSVYNSSATYQREEAWSVSPQYVGPQGVSSAGGYSVIWPSPYYQAGVSSKARASPDVAADANPYTGMVIVLEGGTYVIGGTSLSSPLWAGMTADLDGFVGRSLGPLNPYLYSIYANRTAYASDFHQVSYGFNGEYLAGPGYNLVTGLGSPNLPNLAADIKSQAQGLTVDVSTVPDKGSVALAQYNFGDTLTISATATTPQGSAVTAGSFTAKIEGANGLIASIPLTYGGTSWTGTHKISVADPSGQWTITVSGSSGGASGSGLGEADVGNSIGIVAPIPYPFGAPVTPDVSFVVQAIASTPGGRAILNATLTAELVYEGRIISSMLLPTQGSGTYGALDTVTSRQPQGSYTLVITGPGFGAAFTYFYVGQSITGVMLTPNDDAIPSASAGENVTFLAKAETATGAGLFTTNITAKVYSLSGALMASVRLQPAPNKVQFGVFNFFRYQQANFTVPANLTRGFYKLQFLSSYKANNSTTGVDLGNFTTGFYVSGSDLTYSISTPTTLYEGQYITAAAKITNSTGAPVTSGVFLATFIPSGYAYEAYTTDFYGYTSVPMFYDAALQEWYTEYQVPSVLTSPNLFVGNLLSLSSGPWTVYVSGESAAAANAALTNAYVDVLPYTYYSQALLDRANVGTSPLIAVNGTGYTLSNIGATTLSVRGLHITLSGSTMESLTVYDSTVWLDDTHVGTLTVTNSTVVLAHGTKVDTISPPLPTITVSGLSQPLTGNTGFTVTVSGEQLTNGSLAAAIDGSPVAVVSTASSSGLTARGTVSIAGLPDGIHTLVLTAKQSDGLSSSITTYFSVSTQGSTVATLTYLVSGLGAVAVVALVVAVLALRKRPQAIPLAPGPSPQV
jgi:subtilase family serine protease